MERLAGSQRVLLQRPQKFVTVIEYKLAKELKDAGFPQHGKGEYWYGDKIVQYQYIDDRGENYLGVWDKAKYIPTLSQLIEACGGGVGFYRFDDLESYAWKTNVFDSSGGQAERYTGKTPEEAVARLWLALQK